MMDAEMGGFELQSHPTNSTQMFAGPNDGLSQTENGVSTYVGLRGLSQRAGYRVLYPTLDMGRYLEIAEADILQTEDLSPADSPFGALGGTRVSVRETAPIVTSRTASRTDEIDDEFDLDIRLGASGWSAPGVPGGAYYAPGFEGEERQAAIKTNGACPTETCKTCVTCGAKTCETCATCAGEKTCATCQTHCAQHTCATCKGEATCATCAGDATCVTCKGEATCGTCAGENTCATCKGDATCKTCETCQTCNTACQQATCGVTCHTCQPQGCIPHTETCCGPKTCY